MNLTFDIKPNSLLLQRNFKLQPNDVTLILMVNGCSIQNSPFFTERSLRVTFDER
jgi:hypothetical protein